MMNNASTSYLNKALGSFIHNLQGEKYSGVNDIGENLYENFLVLDNDFLTILIQLRALGLITQSSNTKNPKPEDTYWSLTPHGDKVMTQVRAIKKQK
jgi:hypothetical protein